MKGKQILDVDIPTTIQSYEVGTKYGRTNL